MAVTITTRSELINGALNSVITPMRSKPVATSLGKEFLSTCAMSSNVRWGEVEVHVDGFKVGSGIVREKTVVWSDSCSN